MIANYRVQAELTAVESTEDGKAIVLGTIDGCVSVLAIIDTNKQDMNQYLAGMPSRDEEVRIDIRVHQIYTNIISYQLLFLHFQLKSINLKYF